MPRNGSSAAMLERIRRLRPVVDWTVLGLVGAGGIGLQLQASLNVLAWPQVTLILIAIFMAVLFSEWVSAKVRHAII